MRLMKASPEAALELDLTPMIDCVFQLILFFMLVTDMNRHELEEIYLPTAAQALADKPEAVEVRPVVNIATDGTIRIKGRVYYDPAHDDSFASLRQYLMRVAQQMPREALDPSLPGGRGVLVAKNPLLIRADQATPARYVQKVMELCGSAGIQIWRIELAAAVPDNQRGAK